ncbi:MAG: FHIPEP family type III secretion protein [Treponema sp.]|nr:FHIPEP family type III secretion protein [Treponema sp.]
MHNKKEKKSFLFIIIVYALMVAVVFIPFSAIVVEVIYGIELATSVFILIYICRNKYKTLPQKVLYFNLYSMAINIQMTIYLLSGLQNGKQLPLISFLTHFESQNTFIVGIILIPLILALTFLLVIIGVRSISESSARFALVTMSQKIFNIDKKYSNHEITKEEAETMKKKLQSEIDFFAAMDGAARFFACNTKIMLIMALIDIAGGFGIGYYIQGKTFLDALNPAITYTTGTVVLYCVPHIIVAIASVYCITNKESDHYSI